MNPVPWLRKGTGTTPAEGGCILQVVDWVHRGGWTDQPPCVHPVLRRLAVGANDTLDDEGRQRLLDLAPRLIGTASNDGRLSVQLGVFCAREVLPVFEARFPGDDRPRRAVEAAEAWIADPCEENRIAANSAAAAAAAAASAANGAAYGAAFSASSAASAASAANGSYAAVGAGLRRPPAPTPPPPPPPTAPPTGSS
jgi:hypothetical protein